MKENLIIKDMYTPQAYFICDKNKNYICPRVKKNLPCGDCKGTKYEEIEEYYNIKSEF